MSMSKFATYDEYQASIKPAAKAIDKTELLGRITAMNAELDAEAQLAKDAARYQWIRDNAREADLYALSIYQGDVLDTAIDQLMARSK